ncbi:MAG: hypothetical protein ACP5FL_02180 [Thermoplasmatota archaeon]
MRTRYSFAMLVAAGLLLVGSVSAVPFNDNDTGYFDIGSFRSYEAGGFMGKYAEQPEGYIISVYAADGSHILDIAYHDNAIDLYFQVLNDAVLKTLLEKEEWLRDYINQLSYKKLTWKGTDQSTCIYSDEHCTVEIHNTSVKFLKIQTTGDIIFSNLADYTVVPHPKRPTTINISQENAAGETVFSGKIMSSNPLSCHDATVVAHQTAMFRSVEIGTVDDEKAIRTVADAIEAGTLGGEITVVRNGEDTYKTDAISYYSNVTVTAVEPEFSRNKAVFNVSGDSHATGKTVKLNFGQNTFSSIDIDELEKNLKVSFDGRDVKMADGLSDVLNPNDDGLQPEYALVEVQASGGKEFFVLVSIPHFSDHQIVIQMIEDNPLLLALAATGAIAIVMVAAWGMFRRD